VSQSTQILEKLRNFTEKTYFFYKEKINFILFIAHQKTQTSSEPDKLVLLGLVPLPFTDLGRPSWPTMGIIVESCSKYLPSERPNINAIVTMLERPVSLALQCVIPLKCSRPVVAAQCFQVSQRMVS
jgi:hypothetical protein